MAENDQLTAAQAAADEAERYAGAMEQEALAAEQRRDQIIASSPELSAGPREHARACRALATQAREEATELRAVADGQEQE